MFVCHSELLVNKYKMYLIIISSTVWFVTYRLLIIAADSKAQQLNLAKKVKIPKIFYPLVKASILIIQYTSKLLFNFIY
jgi:hypothetical protein